ncbi:MAG: beta-mannosidase [Pedobacter sp.]|nr:MAG: beta-mannosidase [Pedobacter sp.]
MKKLLNLLFIVCLYPLCGQGQTLINAKASPETKNLYKNLFKIQEDKTLFGHQDALAYGVGWKYEQGRSDIKSLTDDLPGIYGWDLGGIEHARDKNLDGVPFAKMREYIQGAYQRGAVITLSWHWDNPLTGGSTWDTTAHTVKSILPGGSQHEKYKLWLDRGAAYMHSLTGPQGEKIPVLFRPFHELNGNWFWWGPNTTSVNDFKQIWKFTIDYLIRKKALNNLIIVYNTNSFKDEKEFMLNYPGDQYADVLSFDKYQFDGNGKAFIESTRKELAILTRIAQAKHKLSAFAETGYEAIPDATWWTQTLWPTIKDFPISYVLVWRNAGFMKSMDKMHYYAPYPGQLSAPDFQEFYKNPSLLFEKTTATHKLYQ